MMSLVEAGWIGYKAPIISTIVDTGCGIGRKCGYKAPIISTIVDFVCRYDDARGL